MGEGNEQSEATAAEGRQRSQTNFAAFEQFEESKRAALAADEDGGIGGQEYFRAREFGAQYDLLKEEPQHRVVCVLAAEGYTNKEIAEKMGFTSAWVAYVKKQPWALTLMAKIQGKAAGSAMRILTGAAALAAEKLVHACEGEISGAHVKHDIQVKAANDILNRVYGTAPQLVMHGKVDPKELSDEELAQMLGQAQ